MITGVNHVTLAVTDLARSVAFWRDVAGLRLVADWARDEVAQGAYLEGGALWLCLMRHDGPLPRRRDYTHIALTCAPAEFDTLAARLRAHASEWQENRSEGASVYFLDPDGHRMELHCGTLQSRLRTWAEAPPPGLRLHPE